MTEHSVFIFVRVQGAKPQTVGDALMDSVPQIREIYSIMGEYDLLLRIQHSDLATIQALVTDHVREHPNVASTYTILGYQRFGQSFGFN